MVLVVECVRENNGRDQRDGVRVRLSEKKRGREDDER